ncbi:MAG: lysine--tRNA ligase [Bacteroidia bacterium]|nr:lysine--tRNA ligase [Bacteroidia bacterium]
MYEREWTGEEAVRRAELERLRALGVDPYPAREFVVTHRAAQIVRDFKPEEAERWTRVAVAGRVMNRRTQGKAGFMDLQDESGRIQIYLKRDILCPGPDETLYREVFEKLTAIGDIVGITGRVFVTKTGQVTVEAHTYTFLAKSLRPWPVPREKDGVVYDKFSDPELRHRMRYLDLTLNPEVKERFVKRATMIRAMRDFMFAHQCHEVETPILQPVYGGALARPFVTYHNALDMPLYLRIANELYLKRLIVGGFERVFEFAKDFRNEGMSRFHNPEFTQMEFYAAYKDYLWMMDFVEELLEHTAKAVNGAAQVPGSGIDFTRPWKRMRFFDAITEYTALDARNADEEELLNAAQRLGIRFEQRPDRARLWDELFSSAVEPRLIHPTIVMDYPVEMSPLAKRKTDDPDLVERFEVVCNGKEICNAYSELNDPIDQRARFIAQAAARSAGNDEAMPLDEDFLRALEFGMPPTAGLGVGIDRLAMILTGAPSIQEVLLFPHMRPEHAPANA